MYSSSHNSFQLTQMTQMTQMSQNYQVIAIPVSTIGALGAPEDATSAREAVLPSQIIANITNDANCI